MAGKQVVPMTAILHYEETDDLCIDYYVVRQTNGIICLELYAVYDTNLFFHKYCNK